MSGDHQIYQSPASSGSGDPPPRLKNSRIGVASFALSLISFVGVSAVIGFLAYVSITGLGDQQENEMSAFWGGLGVVICLAFFVVSFALGILGLFQQGFRRTFAVLGVTVSTVCILLVGSMIWIGMNMT